MEMIQIYFVELKMKKKSAINLTPDGWHDPFLSLYFWPDQLNP
jgi:hypothetical protein